MLQRDEQIRTDSSIDGNVYTAPPASGEYGQAAFSPAIPLLPQNGIFGNSDWTKLQTDPQSNWLMFSVSRRVKVMF